MDKRRRRACWVLARLLSSTLLAMLAACSGYSGRHLNSHDTLAAGGDGIPYSLPMAQFKVLQTIDGSSTKYNFAVSWVPDPNQRYTLRVSPGFLSDVGFNFNLNSSGGLEEVGQSQTSEVVPTIEAIGAVAAAAAPFVLGTFSATSILPIEEKKEAQAKQDLLSEINKSAVVKACKVPKKGQPSPLVDSLSCNFVNTIVSLEYTCVSTREYSRPVDAAGSLGLCPPLRYSLIR